MHIHNRCDGFITSSFFSYCAVYLDHPSPVASPPRRTHAQTWDTVDLHPVSQGLLPSASCPPSVRAEVTPQMTTRCAIVSKIVGKNVNSSLKRASACNA